MRLNLEDFFWFGSTVEENFVDTLEKDYKLSTSPLIKGKKASLSEVITEIKKIFNNRTLTHFDGLSCDQKSLNSIFNLAEKNKSSLNHVESEEINNFYSAFQKYGGSLISYNEIKRRSDLIIFVGSFDDFQVKRFINKIDWDKSKINNNIFVIGKKKIESLKNNLKVENLSNLGGLILNCFKNFSKKKQFSKLQKSIMYSKYPVIVINSKTGMIFTEHVFRVLAFINNNLKKVRLFRFNGSDNSSGFVNSCVTKTGFPSAVSFNDWGVTYNPFEYNAKEQKKTKKTQFFFSNLNQNLGVEKFKENIFIGHPNLKNKENFDIYVPVKTPGIDVDGIVVRSDGAGVLKLGKKINSNYIEINQLIYQLM